MNVETANRLMDYRKKAGLSQEELADKLGVSRQAVSKWECAESSPDTDNLIALAKIYGISLDELINGTVDKEEPKNKGLKIQLEDDDGTKATISKEGIDVVDPEKGEMHRDFNPRAYALEGILTGSLTILCVIAYLLCGFLIKDGLGWRNYWIIFLLIPIVPSIVLAIKKRKASYFNYPVFIVMCYLGVGMFIDMWHPTWIAFLTIPVYYIICNNIEKAIDMKKANDNIIDNKED